MPSTGPFTRAALAATLLLSAGCADSPAPSGDDPDSTAWSRSTEPVATGGLVWASGSVVHLSDATTIDAGGPITTYVVAGDGVYFTPAETDEDGLDHGNMTTGPLMFADRDGEVTDTGLTVYVESLGSSPDGRYLGLIDATSGPEDNFSDQPQATAVVLDLTDGTRVVDTTDGMGDVDEDDLAHDYPEIYLSVRFPDNHSAYVEGLGDDVVYSLPGGTGGAADSPLHSPLDAMSSSGEWAIDDRGEVEVLLSVDGGRVRPRTGTPRWDLTWWLDASTVLGVAIGPGPQDTLTLVTCVVPSGRCRRTESTTGLLLRFPIDISPTDVLDLRAGPTS